MSDQGWEAIAVIGAMFASMIGAFIGLCWLSKKLDE
jgi:hypothetical protein